MTLNPAWTFDPALAHVNPFAVLREDAGAIAADIENLWDALEARMGCEALENWVVMEHPSLLQMPVEKVWWLLQNQHDEVMGLDHRGLSIVTKETVRDV